jgi:hypothetical protein
LSSGLSTFHARRAFVAAVIDAVLAQAPHHERAHSHCPRSPLSH